MIPDLKLVPYSEIGQTEIMVIQRTKNQSRFDRDIQNGSWLVTDEIRNLLWSGLWQQNSWTWLEIEKKGEVIQGSIFTSSQKE